MRVNERIVDTLERAYSANAWHGPALKEVLDGVEHQTAAAQPIAGAHSIWQLVIHLTAWKDVVRRRLSSPTPILPSDAEDFPPLPEPTPENWLTSLEKLELAHRKLLEAVRATPIENFDSTVPGKDYAAFVMLLGVAQHDDYHGGQIALLKKAARSAK
jgi:uncharacterized damage-inducible protein DinB